MNQCHMKTISRDNSFLRVVLFCAELEDLSISMQGILWKFVVVGGYFYFYV